ncbi:FeoA family protein [Algoriphagus jejuensis]|uniref:FeoA family protein n=1 Tax=Algoriphagus jejuensis TaxID=419934 RepID=A0ABP3YED4_9BACT
MNADTLPLNKSGKILEIVPSPLKINLMELGFLPGKKITLQHLAPSGDPMAFLMEDTLLALRKSEAALIRVEQI